MNYRMTKYALILGLAGVIAGLGPPRVSRASVAVGFDLFQTLDGTTFGGNAFKGVGLGSFNFPGIGVRITGNADTIVQRLPPPATSPLQTIDIQMLALHLMSVNPIGPLGSFVFVTLQSERGGPASAGKMTINSLDNTFTSFINVVFDERIGALDGPIFASMMDTVRASGVHWQHDPPTGLAIPGVNRFLDGLPDCSTTLNPNCDFWPVGAFTEMGDFSAIHKVRSAVAPEPSSIVLLTIGILGMAGSRWLRRKKAA